jgi:hypothetical protein
MLGNKFLLLYFIVLIIYLFTFLNKKLIQWIVVFCLAVKKKYLAFNLGGEFFQHFFRSSEVISYSIFLKFSYLKAELMSLF